MLEPYGNKELYLLHGIKANAARRRGLEQNYFLHYKAQGVKLRGKYRLPR